MFNQPLSTLLNSNTKSYKELTIEDIGKKAQSSDYYKKLYKPYPNVEGYEKFSNIARLFSAYLYIDDRLKDGSYRVEGDTNAPKRCAIISKAIMKEEKYNFWIDKFFYGDLLQYGLPLCISGIKIAAPCSLVMLPIVDDFNCSWLFWICVTECENDSGRIIWTSGTKESITGQGNITLEKYNLEEYTVQLPSLINKDINCGEHITHLIIKLFLYLQQGPQTVIELPIPTKTQGFGKHEPLLTTKWLSRNEIGFKYPLDYQPKGTHKSPITHERMGHWKNVPIGKRGSGEYIRKWIRPTTVNQPLNNNKDLLIT